MKLRKSDIFFLILFVVFLPLFLFISQSDLVNPIIMLIIYPIVVAPLWYFYKKYDNKERKAKEEESK